MRIAMLLLAAGRSHRFGGAVPKVYAQLGGKPVLLHSAERLRQLGDRDQAALIVVVDAAARTTWLPPLLPALTGLGASIVTGGSTRMQSMQRGLELAPASATLILVHDAARPLFPVAAARQCLLRAGEVGAALLAVPATDTLKRVGSDGLVRATIDRAGVWCAQTPQAARRELLQAALADAVADGREATDDVALIEAAGGQVAVVEGAASNLKITRPEDLACATALLAAEAR